MTTRPMDEWFYSAPIDAVAVRRGDNWGMRAIAEEMAEQLAPGLSNRTMGGRRISIICWAVGQDNVADQTASSFIKFAKRIRRN